MGQHTRIGQQCKVTAKIMPPILPRKALKTAPENAKELRQMVPREKMLKNAEENTKTLQKLIRECQNTPKTDQGMPKQATKKRL